MRSRDYKGYGNQVIQVGNVYNEQNSHAGRVYDTDGISPTVVNSSDKGSMEPPKIATPVLTPERPKRQNDPRFRNPGDPMFSLTGQDIHGVQQQARIRRLTPKECERLQAFPDDWTRYGDYDGEVREVSDTQRYRQMGNAVTTSVITYLGERILEAI